MHVTLIEIHHVTTYFLCESTTQPHISHLIYTSFHVTLFRLPGVVIFHVEEKTQTTACQMDVTHSQSSGTSYSYISYVLFILTPELASRATSLLFKMLHQLFQPFNSFTLSFSSLHHDNVQRRCSICQWTPALTWDALTRSFVMRCTQYSIGISLPFIPLYRLRPALALLQLLYTRW